MTFWNWITSVFQKKYNVSKDLLQQSNIKLMFPKHSQHSPTFWRLGAPGITSRIKFPSVGSRISIKCRPWCAMIQSKSHRKNERFLSPKRIGVNLLFSAFWQGDIVVSTCFQKKLPWKPKNCSENWEAGKPSWAGESNTRRFQSPCWDLTIIKTSGVQNHNWNSRVAPDPLQSFILFMFWR